MKNGTLGSVAQRAEIGLDELEAMEARGSVEELGNKQMTEFKLTCEGGIEKWRGGFSEADEPERESIVDRGRGRVNFSR